MKMKDLGAYLLSIGIPESYFSIGKLMIDREIVIIENEKFHVFYWERGRRNCEHVFDNEEDACNQVLKDMEWALKK